MAEDLRRRTRSGGRAGGAARRGSEVIRQMPWNPPVNIDRPTEPLDPEGVAAIHDGAMRILEEIGIAFLNPEAVEILRASGGCEIDGDTIRMGRDFVMEMVGKALAAIIHRGRIFALVRAARGAHDLHAQPEFSPQG